MARESAGSECDPVVPFSESLDREVVSGGLAGAVGVDRSGCRLRRVVAGRALWARRPGLPLLPLLARLALLALLALRAGRTRQAPLAPGKRGLPGLAVRHRGVDHAQRAARLRVAAVNDAIAARNSGVGSSGQADGGDGCADEPELRGADDAAHDEHSFSTVNLMLKRSVEGVLPLTPTVLSCRPRRIGVIADPGCNWLVQAPAPIVFRSTGTVPPERRPATNPQLVICATTRTRARAALCPERRDA